MGYLTVWLPLALVYKQASRCLTSPGTSAIISQQHPLTALNNACENKMLDRLASLDAAQRSHTRSHLRLRLAAQPCGEADW